MSNAFVTISVTDGASGPVLDLLKLNGSVGYQIAGQGVLEAVREHLTARDAIPHPKGWPKTHFNDRARQQSFLRTTSFDATVHIALIGFGTYYSGKPEVIRPVNAKLLTIPAQGAAYGRRAREFSDLVFRIVPNEQGKMVPALVRAEQTVFAFGRRKKDGTRSIKGKTEVGGDVFFWLARSVHPKPHPEAIPTTATMQAAAIRELESYVSTL